MWVSINKRLVCTVYPKFFSVNMIFSAFQTLWYNKICMGFNHRAFRGPRAPPLSHRGCTGTPVSSSTKGVIIRLRCSSFSDDLYIYIYRFHRGPCKNTKKSCRVFISERIGAKFGMPVGDVNAPNSAVGIFFRTIP